MNRELKAELEEKLSKRRSRIEPDEDLTKGVIMTKEEATNEWGVPPRRSPEPATEEMWWVWKYFGY